MAKLQKIARSFHSKQKETAKAKKQSHVTFPLKSTETITSGEVDPWTSRDETNLALLSQLF